MKSSELAMKIEKVILDHADDVVPVIVEYTRKSQPDAVYNLFSDEEQYRWGRNAITVFARAMVDPSTLDVPLQNATSLDIVVDNRNRLIGPAVTAINWLFIVQEVEPYIRDAFCSDPSECDLAIDYYFKICRKLIAITMQASVDRMLSALSSIQQGMTAIPSPGTTPGSPRVAAQHDESLLSSLSPREVEVLKLVSLGKSNGEVAQALGIAQNTVRNHVSRLLSKLGLASRSQLAIYSMNNGIITSQDVHDSIGD